jgi:methylenetetrahydrofolate reductase (NADPH)
VGLFLPPALKNRTSVQNLVRNYSIETTVHEAERVERFEDLVTSGTRIYIPLTPVTSFQETIALAARLRGEGLEPVPHIVARRTESLSILDDYLARLAGEAGVAQVLVVAGDIAKPAGELHSALQILESGLLEKHKIRTVGVAGHPEGHRDISDPILRGALRSKNAYAQNTGASVYIVTQFTFSADPIVAWETSHGNDINRLPITVGLPGLATARTLLKYAMDCGVGPSLQAFSKRYASLTKLLTISAPDRSIVALARYKGLTPHSRIAGVHFVPFGGFKRTADWANKLVEGNFEITDDDGLKVD